MDSTNYKKMNLRKLFLPLCSVALCLQSYAQDKSFLKDMLWYICLLYTSDAADEL